MSDTALALNAFERGEIDSEACSKGLEGLVSKWRDRPCRPTHHYAAAQYIAIASTIKTPAATVTVGMLLISGVITPSRSG